MEEEVDTPKRIPNAATKAAMQDVLTRTNLTSFNSVDDLMADLNSPNEPSEG